MARSVFPVREVTPAGRFVSAGQTFSSRSSFAMCQSLFWNNGSSGALHDVVLEGEVTAHSSYKLFSREISVRTSCDSRRSFRGCLAILRGQRAAYTFRRLPHRRISLSLQSRTDDGRPKILALSRRSLINATPTKNRGSCVLSVNESRKFF